MAGPYTQQALRNSYTTDPFGSIGGAVLGYQQNKLAHAQFNAELGLRQQQLAQQGEQFNAQMTQQGEQFDKSHGLATQVAEAERTAAERAANTADHLAGSQRLLAEAQALAHKASAAKTTAETDRYVTQTATLNRKAMSTAIEELKQGAEEVGINLASEEGFQAFKENPRFQSQVARLAIDSLRVDAVASGHKDVRLVPRQNADGTSDFAIQVIGEGTQGYLGSPDGSIENARGFTREDMFEVVRSNLGATNAERAEAAAGVTPGELVSRMLTGGQRQGASRIATAAQVGTDARAGMNEKIVGEGREAAARDQAPGSLALGQTIEERQAAQALDADLAKDLVNNLKLGGSDNFSRHWFRDNKYEVFAGNSQEEVIENIVRYTSRVIDSDRSLALLKTMGYDVKDHKEARRLTRDPDIRRKLQEVLVRAHETTTRGQQKKLLKIISSPHRAMLNPNEVPLSTDDELPIPSLRQIKKIVDSGAVDLR